MPLTVSELEQQLTNGKLQRVYLLIGDETILNRQAWNLIRQTALGLGGEAESKAATSSWNEASYSAAETSAREVLAAASVLPFLGGRRVVRVVDVDAWSAEEVQTLAREIARLPESACLVLQAGEGKQELAPLRAAVESQGSVVEIRSPAVSALPQQLVEKASRQGYRLALALAARLVEEVGADLQALETELAKVIAYAGPEKVIERKHLQAVQSLSWTQVSEFRIFDLADALAEKRTAAALKILDELLAVGRPPLAILATLAWYWRRLLITTEMLAGGAQPQAIANVMGLKPGALRRLLAHARRFSVAQAKEAFRCLAETESDIKSGRFEGAAALQLLCIKISRV
ncbi:MAG: DNA polymerase III subunit delta [Limnochordales bacterium]|nr:DNA polymerase III subunit delta [Limnochordales bacterium]